MFKLSFITDEYSQDLEKAALFAREWGLQGLELRSLWNKYVHELSQGELHDIEAILRDNALEIPCIASPIFKCNIESQEEYSHHLQIARETVEAAKRLRSPLIRCFTFWRKENRRNYIQDAARRLDSLSALVSGEGLRFVIENEGSTNVGTGAELVELLRATHNRNLGALWDPANSLDLGVKPFPEEYGLIKDRLDHIHVKDLLKTKEGTQQTAVGEGDVDWPTIIRALQKDSYAKYVSLESHYRPGKQLDESTTRLPKGDAFSEGGEEGTRICISQLRAIIEGLNDEK